MATIQKGRAHDVGTKFWEIQDDTPMVITAFNHNRFPHIISGADVYFMDLDLDPRLSENVQSTGDVDGEIDAAGGEAGIDGYAEEVLRDYVMRALWHALDRHGSSRTRYLAQLRSKMLTLQDEARSSGTQVNVVILANHGIA